MIDNENIDDLQYKGFKIIQKANGFRFGVDAVLLANFADIRENANVIDLGTGTGIVSILIAAKTQASRIIGLEIQPEMAEMAARSIKLNGLEDKVNIICGDIKNCVKLFGSSVFDVVVTNPPYMVKGGGIINQTDTKAVSRHEVLCTLEDVISNASKILKPDGQFAMVHRPERLVDIICLLRAYSIEPKYIRFVHPSPYKKPNLLLIKGIRGGRPYLKMMNPLYVYDDDGNYSKEINEIYSRGMV